MDANDEINQLVDLMADLVPTVDKLTRMQERANVEMHGMRTSNVKLAVAIESLIDRLDK